MKYIDNIIAITVFIMSAWLNQAVDSVGPA